MSLLGILRKPKPIPLSCLTNAEIDAKLSPQPSGVHVSPRASHVPPVGARVRLTHNWTCGWVGTIIDHIPDDEYPFLVRWDVGTLEVCKRHEIELCDEKAFVR